MFIERVKPMLAVPRDARYSAFDGMLGSMELHVITIYGLEPGCPIKMTPWTLNIPLVGKKVRSPSRLDEY